MQKIVKPLLKWYDLNKRDLLWRQTKDPYRIWISEIMLQQTRVDTVKSYYARFIKQLPTIQDLANVDDDQLLKLWEGLGYYSRAKNLKIAANQIMENYNGVFPKKYEEIIKLKGIGSYTAGAISSIAFNEKRPAVDGNVLRVISRVLGSKDDISLQSTIKKIQYELSEILPKRSGDFNQSLMELGATICTPKQYQCHQCPIKKFCVANKLNIQNEIPVKNKAIKRSIHHKTIVLFVVEDEIAIYQNNDSTLFFKLWHFPTFSKLEKEKVIEKFDCIKVVQLPEFKHQFTHMDWYINGFVVYLNEKTEDYEWKNIYEIQENIALPTVYKKYFEQYLLLMKEFYSEK